MARLPLPELLALAAVVTAGISFFRAAGIVAVPPSTRSLGHEEEPETAAAPLSSSFIRSDEKNATSEEKNATSSSLESPETTQLSSPDGKEEENCSSMCCLFGDQQHQHPTTIWRNHLGEIHKASRLAADADFKLHDLTAQALNYVTPLLPASVRSLPRAFFDLKLAAIAEKAWARYRYIQSGQKQKQQEALPPPPVTIVVSGGSLALGVVCSAGSGGVVVRDEDCAWPKRLENLLNRLLLGNLYNSEEDKNKLVQVLVAAQGGKDTFWSTELWKYDLLPRQDVDIAINAHATNDMHENVMQAAAQANQTHVDKIFDMRQQFARTVVGGGRQAPCAAAIPAPLLIWLDDYLGNVQRRVVDIHNGVSQVTQLLVNHYGMGSVSFATAVYDLKLADTRESFFSENWYGDKTDRTVMTRAIHPGEGMHMTTAWMMLYYFLHLGTQYCSMQNWHRDDHNKHNETLQNGLPLRHDKASGLDIVGPNNLARRLSVGARTTVLPPPLDKNLNLEHVSEELRQRHASQQQVPTSHHGEPVCSRVRCPVSWMSAIAVPGEESRAYPQRKSRIRHARNFFAPFLSRDGGWRLKKQVRWGWVPPPLHHRQQDGLMVLEFGNLSQPIQFANFLVFVQNTDGGASPDQLQINLDSRALPETNRTNEPVPWRPHRQIQIAAPAGRSNGAEGLWYEMELKNAVPIGHDLRLRFQLTNRTGGEQVLFELRGMHICSHKYIEP